MKMTIEELTKIEVELYSAVLDILEKNETDKLEFIYESYKNLHKHYSELAEENNEALKRGLFIQWYAYTGDDVGIGKIDKIAEENIINQIENKIQKKDLDDELNWMLNYYANWDFVFEKFKSYTALTEFILNRKDIELIFDKVDMSKRGQMGEYWNSLNRK